jgi:small conductance mechanosensitive channel
MTWDWNKIYDTVIGWLITRGPRIVAAIILLFVGIWLLRIFNRWVRIWFGRRRHINASVRSFLQNLIAMAMQILLILLVMQVAGIQLTFFTAIVAGLSVAAGLALSGTLQNFVSGILILLLRPYRVGDTINTQAQEGVVTSIQLFFTTVLTYDNKTITIPNGQLSNNVVVNLSKEGKRRIDIDLKYPYTVEIEKIKESLVRAVASSSSCLAEPKIRIGVSALETDHYVITLNVWTNSHGFIDSRYQLLENILKENASSNLLKIS